MITISQINTSEGRKYQTSIGELPSVTTILQATMPRQRQVQLQRWRDENPVNGAAGRGTIVHSLIEAQLRGKTPECPDELFEYWQPVHQIVAALGKPVAIEEAVYHPELRYAGTLGVIATWRGQLSLIDWKTSHKPKRLSWMGDAMLQLAAYKAAFEALNGILIAQAIVVVISPNRVQTFEFNSAEIKQHWQQWLERLEEYNRLIVLQEEVKDAN